MIMMKVLVVLGAILVDGTSGQSVLQKLVTITKSKVSDKNKTVEYFANPRFKTCSCDLHVDQCDPYCCCDSKCGVSNQNYE